MASNAHTKADPIAGFHGRLLDLDLLKALITVNDTKSFTLAAERLECTQAAVSQQIQRLEGIVGFELVRRSQRSLRLTDEGEVLAQHGRRMLALNDEVFASLRPGTVSGTVRIGAMDNYAIRILPPLLAKFSKQHPAVRVEILTGLTHALTEMLGKDIDLLIAPELSPSGHILRTERTVWVAGASSTVHKREPLPMAMLPQGSFFRDITLNALEQSKLSWYPAFVCTSLATMMAIVTAGLAIGVCPESLTQGGLKRLHDKRLPVLPGVYITLRDAGERMSSAAKVLHEFLVTATTQR